ncbi:unnamed protein product [Calicophoron daubneyi]|uniref:Uncharacterized protein n=1 Tax=Calicophoron daubneyi TaxID=300641 RepID=A0AAV2TJ53_CALDB
MYGPPRYPAHFTVPPPAGGQIINYLPSRPQIPVLNPPPWCPAVSPYPPPVPRFCPPIPTTVSPSFIPSLAPVDEIAACVDNWLAINEPRLIKARDQRRSKVLKIPVFRTQLVRWRYLIDQMKLSASNGIPISPSLKDDLLTKQKECTDPQLLEAVQQKIRRIKKKRRYLKRRRQEEHASEQEPRVVRSSVADVLGRLRSQANSPYIDETSECIRATPSPHSSEAVDSPNTKSENQSEYRHCKSVLEMTQEAKKRCKDRIALLSLLEKLRSARLTQARQKGGLFPDAFDQAFAAQVGELRSMLQNQISNLEALQRTNEQSSVGKPRKLSLNIDEEYRGEPCCNHIPDLPDNLKRLLFGSECTSNVPWRWQRFYHQADFDFNDFLRIRRSWDNYLVQRNSPENSTSSETADGSQLPATWSHPSLSSPDDKWRSYLITPTQDTKETS